MQTQVERQLAEIRQLLQMKQLKRHAPATAKALAGIRTIYFRQDLSKPPMPTAIYDAKHPNGMDFH